MNLWPLIAFTISAVALALGITVAAFRLAPSDPGPMDEDGDFE